MLKKNVPMYKLISDSFKEKILNGELKNGEKLPTESQIISDFNVSRITATHALDMLENDGYAKRVQGSGTYVEYTGASQLNDHGQIGFVIPDFSDFPYMRIISGISSVLEKSNYILVFYRYSAMKKEVSTVLEKAANECKGLIYYPNITDNDFPALRRLKEKNYPIYVIDRLMDDPDLSCIISNNRKGAEELTKHFIDKGHKKLAFFSGIGTMPFAMGERYLGCCTEFLKNGLPIENMRYYSLYKDYAERDFYDSLSDKARKNKSIEKYKEIYNDGNTGIICVNDWLALSALVEFTNMGIKIPDEIAIAGFDDLPTSAYSNPPLTTLAQDFFKIGVFAANDVITLIQEKTPAPIKRILPMTFIPRKSV